MKYVAILTALGVGCAVLLINSQAFAQGPGHGAFLERLRAADTNGDGMLSRDEAAAALPRISEHFDEIDANHDGYITFDELHAYMAAHRHGHGGWFKRLDKDGDGKLSRD